jgi:hypothetical protein
LRDERVGLPSEKKLLCCENLLEFQQHKIEIPGAIARGWWGILRIRYVFNVLL